MPHSLNIFVLCSKNRVESPSQAMLLRNQHSVLSCTSPPSFQLVAKIEKIKSTSGDSRKNTSFGVSSDLCLRQS